MGLFSLFNNDDSPPPQLLKTAVKYPYGMLNSVFKGMKPYRFSCMSNRGGRAETGKSTLLSATRVHRSIP